MPKNDKPLEISSKIPVSWRREIFPTKKLARRDPRFSDDKANGIHDPKEFEKNYGFLEEVRRKERKDLQMELKRETDEDRRQQIMYLIQRLDNQEKAKEAAKKKEERKQQLMEATAKEVGEGKKVYVNKGQLKKLELVEKFKELKKSSKLDKYLEKKRKRNTQKDKKKFLKPKV